MKKFIILICLCLLCFSCSKKEEIITFEENSVLDLAPDVKWALITEPYAAYRKNMDFNSDITGYCRKGDILKVLGHSTDKKNNSWYKFDKGWIPSSSLIVYSNKYKAQSALEQLKD